jgi:hypothetical protein
MPNQRPISAYQEVEDIDMRRIAVVALVLMALSFSAAAAKNKPPKTKEKRFEPIAVEAASVAGSYRGPAESYGLVLELSNDGTLRGNYVEMGRVAVLHTIVKAEHFTQLRSAVNAMRTAAALAPASFTDTTLTGLRYKTVHVTELRTALNEALIALGRYAEFTDPTLESGMPVRTAHVREIRDAVK